MGKRYRNRRRKNKYGTNPLPLLVAFPLSLLFYFFRDQFKDKNPVVYAFSFLFAVIIISSLIALMVYLWKRHRKLKRRKTLQIADIDRMPGIEFEHYVAELLRNQGFEQVQVTPSANDFGIDILFSKESISYAAQVKRHRGLVGVAALYQAIGGRDYYQKNQAVVICNSFYSLAAQELARKTNLWLVDRNQLADWIDQFSKA
jgi:restriction system protein